MRADRLIQALLLLQGRERITAAELAAELEVSVPTARRDLEALAMAGVPIYPSRGRGGGWRLIGGARTDLTGLTESEVTSLLIGLTQGGAAEPERIAAVRKLVQAAPAPFREGARRVADATVRDLPWGEAADASEARAVAELQRAIARRRQARVTYAGSYGEREIVLVPLVVGSRGARWYLLGAPTAEGTEIADIQRLRTYRVDRIRAQEVLSAAGAGPADFDAHAEWSRMVDRVEQLRGAVRAWVRVQPWAVRALTDRFGAQARVPDAQPDADGRSLVEVSAHRVSALAEQLAGWTGVAEVVEPAEVRAALRDLGEQILATYSAHGEPAPLG
ncbi:WYL domain-containing protein [Microbacterium resistens]|uniref:helix-turn-helix transcriptional regulator n=1 Tax=Microbacterium resistens TaxID=156977 RepID=UPI001C5734DB|nr:WYL domain-containing protein [Microbacterium resistens]MBW1638586.1 WYL domain-containing protein [Microbacterium resistens]